MSDELTYFGEWGFYENEEEKKELAAYLKLWKKNFIKKNLDWECVTEQIIDLPDICSTLALELGMRKTCE